MERKPVVVVDTNVLVSGLLSANGVPGLIISKFRSREFKITTSRAQITEIRRVLNRPVLKKALPPGTTREVLRFFLKLKRLAKLHDPPRLKWDFPDKGDHFLLDLVSFVEPDFFVTGDKALRLLGIIGKTPVLSPMQFIGRLGT